MALKKVLTNEKGITTEYHRISRIDLSDKIIVTLSSYVSTEYRDLEKEIHEKQALIESLNQQISEEMAKETPDTELIISLSEQLNAIVITVSGEYNVTEMTEEFELDKENTVSFAAMYNRIRKLDKFKDAENV